MRIAGRVVAEMHEALRAALRPGVTTADLDRIARAVLDAAGDVELPRLPRVPRRDLSSVTTGDPRHPERAGSPRRRCDRDRLWRDRRRLARGCCVHRCGRHDLAAAQRLIDTAERSLAAAIEQMVAGRRLGDVSNAVQRVAEAAGAGSSMGTAAMASGRAMHEEPDVPNAGPSGRGPKLDIGVVLAIEPMLTLGAPTPGRSTTSGRS